MLPNYIGSRADWDAEQERKLRAAFPGDEEGFLQAWERRYPVSVAGAIDELQRRGLNVYEENFATFCDLKSLQRIGRNYVLYAADIDRVAENLEGTNKLTGLAQHRKAYGISFAEESEGLRHVLEVRRERAAKEVGVSLDAMLAAIRVGGISDPAYTPIDVEAAKAWFESHAEDSEYQHELQETK
jgi:hypothetical protein